MVDEPRQDADDPEWDAGRCIHVGRCGASQNKPFCDNSHRLIGFRG